MCDRARVHAHTHSTLELNQSESFWNVFIRPPDHFEISLIKETGLLKSFSVLISYSP